MPSILSWIGGLGIGSLVGAMLSLWQNHHSWVNDNKKSEYRELLDTLYETVTVVSDNRPNLSTLNSGPINDAVKRMARALEDRIFIAEPLRGVNAIEDWNDIKKVIYFDPELQNETPREFRYSVNNIREREDKLRKKILELAGKDIVTFNLFSR